MCLAVVVWSLINAWKKSIGDTSHFGGAMTCRFGWGHTSFRVTGARVGLLALHVGSWESVPVSPHLLCQQSISKRWGDFLWGWRVRAGRYVSSDRLAHAHLKHPCLLQYGDLYMNGISIVVSTS